MKNRLVVCYIINMLKYTKRTEDQLKHLMKSIKTLNEFYQVDNLYILFSYNGERIKEFYGVKNQLQNYLSETCTNIGNYNIIETDIQIIKDIKFPYENTNIAIIDKTKLLKFYIPEIINEANIWYLNNNIEFSEDFSDDLWYCIDKDTLFKVYEIAGNLELLYINCEKYKELNVLNEVIDFCNNSTNILSVDKHCLENLVVDRFKNNVAVDTRKTDKKNLNISAKSVDQFGISKFSLTRTFGFKKENSGKTQEQSEEEKKEVGANEEK